LPTPDHVVSTTRPEPSKNISRILVLCPDNDTPSGGVRRLYRHVDVLCARGMPAWIVHEKPGFRCRWFNNTTPILGMSQAQATPSDYLVLPEIFAHGIAAMAPGVPKVIFNQNAYFTFRGWPIGGTDGFAPYRHPDVVATLAVSEDNLDYLRYAFPGITAHRVHYGIDPLFTPQFPKRKALAYMPRKNAQDAVQVLNLLRGREALSGWELVPIDGVPETEVAKRLGECALFLSFGHPEGCPLPPLEAMASGCVIAGYHGRGGREYFDPAFSYPVEVGDVVGFAKAVEDMLGAEQREPGMLERKGKLAAEYVRANYSPEREAQGIVAIWETIVKARNARH
jgi:glycosyltransferase involved in cell wall biosynthesis